MAILNMKSKETQSIKKKVVGGSDKNLYQELFGLFKEFQENESYQNKNNLILKAIEIMNENVSKKIISLKKDNENLFSNDLNIFFFDKERSISAYHADKIYSCLQNLDKTKSNLNMILLSYGGYPSSAYLISKLCKNFTKNFRVVIPRFAKSAATILSCSAREIHMGALSELGPIDPQIDGKPSLALKNAIEHISELVKKYPESYKMFSNYLYLTVNPVDIGYYERVAESSKQYISKLLEFNDSIDNKNLIENIANCLVYSYKDHGFVIDKDEAEKIFGNKMIKYETDLYKMGSIFYEEFENMYEFFKIFGYHFSIVGELSLDYVDFTKIKK